ncbi:hypothetical protein AVEN_177439-1, partial [Araneus ventricosus]
MESWSLFAETNFDLAKLVVLKPVMSYSPLQLLESRRHTNNVPSFCHLQRYRSKQT